MTATGRKVAWYALQIATDAITGKVQPIMVDSALDVARSWLHDRDPLRKAIEKFVDELEAGPGGQNHLRRMGKRLGRAVERVRPKQVPHG